MYGIAKVSGELLCSYYTKRYGMDIRCLRYPGIISSVTPPGGGTTDYNVHMFYEAIKKERYSCFVRAGTHPTHDVHAGLHQGRPGHHGCPEI